MKVNDILQIICAPFLRLKEYGIKPSDVEHLPLYADFCAMKEEGEKVSYIIAVLAERYDIGERSVYYIIKRLDREI